MEPLAAAGRVVVTRGQISYRTGMLGRPQTVVMNAVQGYRRRGAFVEIMVNGRWTNMNCGTGGGAKKIHAAIAQALNGPEPTSSTS